jgi:hypothetical protein
MRALNRLLNIEILPLYLFESIQKFKQQIVLLIYWCFLFHYRLRLRRTFFSNFNFSVFTNGFGFIKNYLKLNPGSISHQTIEWIFVNKFWTSHVFLGNFILIFDFFNWFYNCLNEGIITFLNYLMLLANSEGLLLREELLQLGI